MTAPLRAPSRRTFLRSAGAAVALPFLDSLTPRPARAGVATPRRLLVFYIPNGVIVPSYVTQGTGSNFTLSPILSPLEAVKSELLILSNVANRPGQPGQPGDHAGGTGAFLTCNKVYKTKGPDIKNAISMDQLLVQRLQPQTPFPSLQLGLEGGDSAGACDVGAFSCSYTRTLSWTGPQTPLPKVVGPRAAFDLLFAGSDPGRTQAEIAQRRRLRKSVLDSVRGEAQSLQSRLGRTDQQKLDEYLSGVRGVEQRIDLLNNLCQPGDRPAQNATIPEQSLLMNELMVLAFRCDLTRIMTYMLANGQTDRPYPFIGVPSSHHQISHHQNDPKKIADLVKICTWEVAQLAHLVQRLKEVQDGTGQGGSLLDQTVVYFSSELADPNSHMHYQLPVVLAGRCGGAFRTGQHIAFPKEVTMGSLFISIMAALGLQVPTFGMDGVGALPGLG